jgi:hypothetical protein
MGCSKVKEFANPTRKKKFNLKESFLFKKNKPRTNNPTISAP